MTYEAASTAQLLVQLSPVHAFSPDAIPRVSMGEAIFALAPHVDTISIGADQTAWSLREDVRIAALAKHHDAHSALESARSIEHRAITPTQRLLERWLERGAVRPDEEGLDLDAFERVTRWLSQVDWARGAAQQARADSVLVRRRRSLEGLANKLVGRGKELDRLEAAALGNSNERVLVLDALGGMGKSALIAGVELRLDAWKQDAPVVIVHLDLDSVEIDYRSSISLLAAMVRQLSARLPQTFARFAEEVSSLETFASNAELESAQVGNQVRAELDSRELFLRDETEKLLAQAFSEQRLARLLVVVDTLERPQRDAPGVALLALDTLWRIIDTLPAAIVLAGRAIKAEGLLGELAARVPLSFLDPGQARQLLQDRGVPEGLAQNLAQRLPGRPLTLRLAARAVVEKEVVSVDDPQLQRAIDRALVDGFLQLRMLDHVDPRLHALIRPGFALRRLTPRLIHEVLGGYASPPVGSVAEASELIDRLRRVSELVLETDGPALLVLRPEVRSELLSLIKVDRRDLLREVHHKAATWYGERLKEEPDPASRAELVYHLLAHGDVHGAQREWDDAAVIGLADMLDELEEPAYGWLASRLARHGVAALTAAPPEEDAQASLRAWEQRVLPNLESAISAHRLKEAEQLLLQRHDRSHDSPLFLPTARLYRLLNDPAKADENAHHALSLEHDAAVHNELLRIAAWVACRHDRQDALQLVQDSLAHVQSLPDPVEQLRDLVDLASILAPRADSASRRLLWSIDDQVGVVFDEVPDRALAADRSLLTRAASLLHDSARLQRALVNGVLSRLRDPNLNGLFLLLAIASDSVRQNVASICGISWHPPDPYPEDRVTSALSISPTRVAKVAEDLLSNADSARVAETIRQLIARDAVGDAEGSSTELRVAAMRELERFLGARRDSFARWWNSATTSSSDGGAGFAALLDQAREAPAPGLFVAAVDRVGIFNAVLFSLAQAWPDDVRELGALRAGLVRPAPFELFKLERIAALHAALVAAPLSSIEVLRELWSGNAFQAKPPQEDNLGQLSVALYNLLVLSNETERLGGHNPMELFLLNARQLPLSNQAEDLATGLLRERVSSLGTDASAQVPSPARAVAARPVKPLRQALLAPWDKALIRVSRAVAEVRIPQVIGGRATRDASGEEASVMASGWLVAPNLLMTAFHVLRAQGESVDLSDLSRRAELATVVLFDGGSRVTVRARSLAAWSDRLDYALLEIDPNPGTVLDSSSETPAVYTVLRFVQIDAKGEQLFGTGQVLSSNQTRLEHDIGTEPGASGAPLVDKTGQVVAMELAFGLNESGERHGIAVRVSSILDDLRARLPELASLIDARRDGAEKPAP